MLHFSNYSLRFVKAGSISLRLAVDFTEVIILTITSKFGGTLETILRIEVFVPSFLKAPVASLLQSIPFGMCRGILHTFKCEPCFYKVTFWSQGHDTAIFCILDCRGLKDPLNFTSSQAIWCKLIRENITSFAIS